MNFLITKCKFYVNEKLFFDENRLIFSNTLIVVLNFKSVSRCQHKKASITTIFFEHFINAVNLLITG